MNPIVCCQDLQVRQEIHKLGVLILPVSYTHLIELVDTIDVIKNKEYK